ncbi:hypothetical protein SAMN05444377_104219 [Flavobacterium fontis]|uniref:Uncharacterized protein n=1 Tax=Flavobacterium fontis TaxID=1124188 RepID=A0A1M4ZK91_9FLAO|nr:hypothetical protein SAMN05444377_104219 [Flavobacterium fontis]
MKLYLFFKLPLTVFTRSRGFTSSVRLKPRVQSVRNITAPPAIKFPKLKPDRADLQSVCNIPASPSKLNTPNSIPSRGFRKSNF